MNIKSITILGVAGGNGLEHIDNSKIKIVYGINIILLDCRFL